MIRQWFDTTAVVAFAQDIARDLNRVHPPTDRQKKDGVTRKDRKRLDGIVLRTRAFGQQYKLNVYKKAKLLNTVKWELREAGQDKAFIDGIVATLAPLLNRR
jgi:hypothetical protein